MAFLGECAGIGQSQPPPVAAAGKIDDRARLSRYKALLTPARRRETQNPCSPTHASRRPTVLTSSRQNLAHHAAGHVGQAEVAPGVAVRQPLVVQAEQVQDRRVARST
jgi:hypothetical protein